MNVAHNVDWTRACQVQPFGIACYEGKLEEDGQFHGTHVGVVKTVFDAHEFLAGKTPRSLIRIYTKEEV